MSFISDNNVTTIPNNTNLLLRETFSDPSLSNWTTVTAPNDIMQLDGNTLGISYLVISKCPLCVGTESSIVTNDIFNVSMEVTAGIHMSQRVVGQEGYYELISDDAPYKISVPDIEIASISQIASATTPLLVTTLTPHGLTVGMRIGIYGVSGDSRLNYTSLIVNRAPTSNTFSVLNSALGALSTTSTIGPFLNTGYVYVRPELNFAVDGIAQVFENTSLGNSSYYVAQDSTQDMNPLPSGITAGVASTSHAVAISSLTSVQNVLAAGQYAFIPTAEYRLLLTPDRAQAYDSGVDGLTTTSSRFLRTQNIPNPDKNYKLRFRVNNFKGATVPNAEIVSVGKVSSNNTLVTTATNHNLLSGDWIILNGVRDQINFPANTATAIATQVQINTIPTPNTFTVNWGTIATANSYGGFVARINGSNTPIGFLLAAIFNIAISNDVVSLNGNVTWALLVGDYVNLYGVRADLTGISLGVDGVYRVKDVSTTSLQVEPIGETLIPSYLATTNCGGSVIKRTDLRLSFARITNYTRERVEILPKPSNDLLPSIPVTIGSGTLTSVSTLGTLGVVSTANLAQNLIVIDGTGIAFTATANSSTIIPGQGSISYECSVVVSVVLANTAYDVIVQESDDSGSNWYDVYHLPRITPTSAAVVPIVFRTPLLPLTGNRIRYSQIISGTNASVTRSINRIQSHSTTSYKRQFFDRNIILATANSTTSSYFIDGCSNLNVIAALGSTTTPPVLVAEVSPDASIWIQVGADISPTANSGTLLQVTNVLSKFVRVRVKTAGTSATLTYIMIKAQE